MHLILKTCICHMAKSAGDEKQPPVNSAVLSSLPQAPPLPLYPWWWGWVSAIGHVPFCTYILVHTPQQFPPRQDWGRACPWLCKAAPIRVPSMCLPVSLTPPLVSPSGQPSPVHHQLDRCLLAAVSHLCATLGSPCWESSRYETWFGYITGNKMYLCFRYLKSWCCWTRK